MNSICINKNLIEKETAIAMLIKMPNKSFYSGYKFWYTKKLIREKGHIISLAYGDDFSFMLFKTGKGKYNKFEIIDKITICAEDLEEAFEGKANIKKNPFETHIPEEIKAVEVDVLDELKDN